MARYKGIIPFSGKMGGLIFRNRKGQGEVSEEPKKPIVQSEATKKSGRDFGRAGKLVGRIKRAFNGMVSDHGDVDFTSRLQSVMMAVFNSIGVEKLGEKQAWDGDLKLLEGFQFNVLTHLDLLLWQKPKLTVEVATGLEVYFAEADVKSLVRKEKHNTAAVFEVTVGIFNLDNGTDEVVRGKKMTVNLEADQFKGGTLKIPVTFGGRQLVVLGVGVHYLSKDERILNAKEKAAAFTYARLLNDGELVSFIPRKLVKKEPAQDDGLDWV